MSEKQRVKMVQERDIDSDINRDQLVQVTSMGVDHSKKRDVLYLSVGEFRYNKKDGNTLQLALTPPAAKQMADRLNKAVEHYLAFKPEKEKE